VATPVLHRSQLAKLLGLPLDDEAEAAALAWDCAALLDAWVDGVRDLPLAALIEPTRSRGRTLRNLTVNVLHPFELVPGAFEEGVFPWDPDADAERERALATALAIVDYAREHAAGWRWFLAGLGDRLEQPLPLVRSTRGEIAFADLLAQQRWHAAFHYRQLVVHREESGRALPSPFGIDHLIGLDLPDEVF
jgi:hypothetical protein